MRTYMYMYKQQHKHTHTHNIVLRCTTFCQSTHIHTIHKHTMCTHTTIYTQVHNIPEGLAKATVLVAQGVSARRALWWSVLTCLPQPLVAVPSFLFVDTFRVCCGGWGGYRDCVHVYICVYMCVHVSACVYMCIYVCTCPTMYPFVCIMRNTPTHTRTLTSTHTHSTPPFTHTGSAPYGPGLCMWLYGMDRCL